MSDDRELEEGLRAAMRAIADANESAEPTLSVSGVVSIEPRRRVPLLAVAAVLVALVVAGWQLRPGNEADTAVGPSDRGLGTTVPSAPGLASGTYDPSVWPLGDDPAVCVSATPADPVARENPTVPQAAMIDVIGVDYAEALEIAKSTWPGQRVLLSLETTTDVDEGTVVRSDPNPGASVAPDRLVVLYVAVDPARFGEGDPADNPTEPYIVPAGAGPSGLIPGLIDVGMSSPATLSDLPQPVTFLAGEVVGCSVVSYGFVWLDQRFELDNPTGLMPDVVGLTITEAAEMLNGVAFEAFGSCMDSDLGGRIIVSQSPEPGDPVTPLDPPRLERGCGLGVAPGSGIETDPD